MRTQLRLVRELIKEAIMDDRYMDKEAAQAFISDMDGDETSDTNIVDEDSGEVYLNAGDSFSMSPWNPDHTLDKKRAENDEQYAREAGVWDEYHGDDIEPSYDPTAEHREEERAKDVRLEDEFHRAVREFATSAGEYVLDQPDNPHHEDAAWDLADGFFYQHSQDKIKDWLRVMGYSRQNAKENIADHVYDEMQKNLHRMNR